jgi:hypothetical protein
MSDTWDFDHQRAETAHTVETLAAEAGLNPSDRIVLDLQFVPAAEGADRAALEKALTDRLRNGIPVGVFV